MDRIVANLSTAIKKDQNKAEHDDMLDMSLLCRICGATSDYLIPIFEGEGLQSDLYKKISDYLPIKVLRRELLPEQTCYQCASTLLAWHDLVQCCIQADVTLRKKLKLAHPRQAKGKKQSTVRLKEKIENENEVLYNSAAERLSLCEQKLATNIVYENGYNELSANNYDSDQMSFTKDEQTMSPDISDVCFSSDHSSYEDNQPIALSVNGNLHPHANNTKERNSLVYCYFCKKEIVAKTYYSHLQRHSKEKVHTCESCGNCYNDYSNLERHKREIHRNCKKYACTECNKAFNRSQMLLDHVRAKHTKEHVKVCDVCGKSFHTFGHYFNHRKKHREKDKNLLKPLNKGEKNHQCSICLKKFNQSGQLKNHKLVHLTEKAHPCLHCPRKYKVHWKLKEHMKAHHADIGQSEICV